MSGGVFICYRREESAFAARAIRDRVAQRLERENVFLDVDSIDLGVDWFNVLTDRVGACDALVAVIGRDWVSSSDNENRRRIDDPDDFVRIEIEAALKRDVRVIPVLIDGAAMPKAAELPDSVKGLARRQGMEVSPARFDTDVEKLTGALASILEARRTRDADEAGKIRRIEIERGAGQAAEAEKAEPAGPLAAVQGLSTDEKRRNEASEVERAARLLAEAPRRAVSARENLWAIGSFRRRHWVLLGLVAVGLGSMALSLTDFGSLRVERQPVVPLIAPPADKTASTSPDQKPVTPPIVIAKSAPQNATRGEPGDPSSNVITSIPLADVTPKEVMLSKPTATLITPPEPTTPQGQYKLGDDYFYGQGGVFRDNQQAVVWYRRAAEQGHAEAQFALGQFYENGWGVGQDPAQAKKWYTDAARQGIGGADAALKRLEGANTPAISASSVLPPAPTTPQGQYEMGDNYFYGRDGVNRDNQQALVWYRKAAKQGYAEAQFTLGQFYENGWGVDQDLALAKRWYGDAARQGSGAADDALKRLRANTPTTSTTESAHGEPIPPQGPVDAKHQDLPEGINPGSKQAAHWYQEAAERGDAEAQVQLAWLYESGLGVDKDDTQARLWYQRAADQGNLFAQTALSRLQALADTSTLSAGSGGARVGKCDRSDNSVDTTVPVCAATLAAMRAAERGDADAQVQLAWLYESGIGVDKDDTQARLWYQKAADQGDEYAKAALERLRAANVAIEHTQALPEKTATADSANSAAPAVDPLQWVSYNDFRAEFKKQWASGNYPDRSWARCRNGAAQAGAHWVARPTGKVFSFSVQDDKIFDAENAKLLAQGYALQYDNRFQDCVGASRHLALWMKTG